MEGLDVADAFRFYKAEAAKGDSEAQFRLGEAFYHGTGCTQNRWMAFKWFQAAGYKGHLEAMYWMGYIHFYGKGCPMDWEKGVMWLKKAAMQDHPAAQDMLGFCYRFGNGVENGQANKKLAREWYTKAAENGCESSLESLAQMEAEATAEAHYLGIG